LVCIIQARNRVWFARHSNFPCDTTQSGSAPKGIPKAKARRENPSKILAALPDFVSDTGCPISSWSGHFRNYLHFNSNAVM
jgi:hypothetical protein